MALSDLFFGVDVFNRTGRDNIRGDQLALELQAGQNPGALVSGTAPQSIPDATPTTITDWDTVTYDDLSFFNLANPERFTIPETDPVISRVQLFFQYSWQPAAAGFRQMFLEKNGVGGVAGGIAQSIPVVDALAPLSDTLYSMPVECVPGDEFTIVVQQNSTGAIVVVLLGFGIKVAR